MFSKPPLNWISDGSLTMRVREPILPREDRKGVCQPGAHHGLERRFERIVLLPFFRGKGRRLDLQDGFTT